LHDSKVTIKPFLFLLLKVTVAATSLWFIINRITQRDHAVSFFAFIKSKANEPDIIGIIIAVIILMLVNWSIEALKWKLLISKLHKLSFGQSLMAIFAGATISFFTPNRVGDFAGRMVFLPGEVRLSSLLSTFVGNLSQLIVTLICGLGALAVNIQYYVSWNHQALILCKAACAAISFLLLISFPFIKLIFLLPIWQKKQPKLYRYFQHFQHYTYRELMLVLLWSFIRYGVFALQYILLFMISGIAFAPFIISVIMMVFIVQAVVPSVALTEFAFRGSVAIMIAAPFVQNDYAILTASFALWVINLAIPAALGSLMIFYFKPNR
jgi:hypothetical protein